MTHEVIRYTAAYDTFGLGLLAYVLMDEAVAILATDEEIRDDPSVVRHMAVSLSDSTFFTLSSRSTSKESMISTFLNPSSS